MSEEHSIMCPAYVSPFDEAAGVVVGTCDCGVDSPPVNAFTPPVVTPVVAPVSEADQPVAAAAQVDSTPPSPKPRRKRKVAEDTQVEVVAAPQQVIDELKVEDAAIRERQHEAINDAGSGRSLEVQCSPATVVKSMVSEVERAVEAFGCTICKKLVDEAQPHLSFKSGVRLHHACVFASANWSTKTERRLFCGIDPDLKGYITVIDERGEVVEFMPMPIIAGDRPAYDEPAVVRLVIKLRTLGVEEVLLEEQQPIGSIKRGGKRACRLCKQGGDFKMGSVANFKKGGSYMMWRAMLSFAGIRFNTVRPVVWKKALGIAGGDPKQVKVRAITKAASIYPHVDLRPVERSPGAYTPDGAKAEALLLSRYAMLLSTGGLAAVKAAGLIQQPEPKPCESCKKVHWNDEVTARCEKAKAKARGETPKAPKKARAEEPKAPETPKRAPEVSKPARASVKAPKVKTRAPKTPQHKLRSLLGL